MNDYELDDLFLRLRDFYQVSPDRRGWCHTDCPFCGKGDKHFAFQALGYKCVVCGAHGGLRKLAQVAGLLQLGAASPRRVVAAPVPVAVQAAPWLGTAASRISQSLAHPGRLAAWAAYKPLSRATLDRWQFGLGKLPFVGNDGEWYESRSSWLTVPLYGPTGAVCGLRGRNLGTQGPKWISATGSHYHLWGLQNGPLKPVVWLCENYVDAAWLMERHSDLSAVALGGATTWQPAWGEALAAQQPDLVIVALDNDLAGQATGPLYRRLSDERRIAHPDLPALVPNGPRIANDLIALGLTVRLFQWPAKAPAKAGVDWLIEQELAR